MLCSVQEQFMQFYINNLKELKVQFHAYLCIVQLIDFNMGFRK